jgi:DNA segregation ATPase FtsK/SpoIIIE-like protein
VAWTWGMRRAATIAPDERGLFPLLLGRSGGGWAIFDSNRALSAGATLRDGKFNHHVQPGFELPTVAITAGALEVQRTVARSSAYRHLAQAELQANTPALADQVSQADQANAPIMQWPGVVPLVRYIDALGTGLDRVFLGVTVDPNTGQQRPVQAPMSDLVHFAVGGVSGSGKTVTNCALAYQFATMRDDVDLAIVDLKGELAAFRNSDRLLYPVATARDAGVAVLQAIHRELERRKGLFLDVGAGDLDSYNAQCEPGQRLNPLVAVVDEATLLMRNYKDALDATIDVVLLGRSFQVWLLLSGQNWKASTFGSELRDQLQCRIQHKCSDKTQARLLLGTDGAETLPGYGRALVRWGAMTDPIEMQMPWVTRGEIERALSGQRGPTSSIPVVDVEPERDKRADEIIAAYREAGSVTGAAKIVFDGNGTGNNYYRTRDVLQNAGLID